MNNPLKVIVCGTLFGQIYLSAFKQPFTGFELAGILAQGSERSQQLAQDYGVPLYHHVDELPDDIDIACVVIRSAIVGGKGSEIARALLQRGISVLQEHPVYLRDVAECLKLARQQGCSYQVNTHYPHVPAVRQFIDYLREALQTQQALFIEATCGVQVICGLLDILGRVFGRFTPCGFSLPESHDDRLLGLINHKPPYTQLRGVIAGVPLTLNLQNQLDPADPDNHFHIMHRICVGLPSGNLLLANTHGPVLWNNCFHIPRVKTESGCRELIAPELAPDYFLPPLSQTVSNHEGHSHDGYSCADDPRADNPRTDNLQEVLNHHWPSAVRHALRQFADQCQTPTPADAQYLLSLTNAWKSLMEHVGNPESVSLADPIMAIPEIDVFLSKWKSKWKSESEE
ncbi:Gfo/Idh/MocA family oxidoreductase [Xenorhabdus lircayensis]|uniref:Gfo/Idh/MocA family oxidoreductase n=1 Tax=Xenorhabdus lircayensis TaxID=2763499 RepID=A0ABS0U6X0_9GAMM|nr:Gfo/Idh/MocA family oxidoreductase [Xenorhabdus lircayensis]MBI6549626.1 Gfo/Idh/MocA family oxidoreductase [Xenorhabdus lircayensis]